MIPMSERELRNAEISYRSAMAGMVLLENNGALPIQKTGQIALYGIGAVRTVRGGTGSGDPFNGGLSGGGDIHVDQSPRYHIHILDAFLAGGYEVVNEEELRGLAERYDRAKERQQDQVMQTFAFPEPEPDETAVRRAAECCDTGIYVLSRNSGEGSDRCQTRQSAVGEIGDYRLTERECRWLALLRDCYQKLIVVLNVGGIIDLTDVKEAGPDAVLLMGLAGQEGGRAVRDVLNGTVTPAGKLTDTWAKRYEDYPASATFAMNDGQADLEKYEEGIFVGYRYFGSFGTEPYYEFGYGKSYTTFTLTPEGCGFKGALFWAEETVQNSGKYPGAEVLQLYVTAYLERVDMPAWELKAFRKTRELAPGETQKLRLEFTVADLAVYDEKKGAWIVTQGDYLVWTGTSSKDKKPVAIIRVKEDQVREYAPPILPLPEPLKTLSHINRPMPQEELSGLLVFDAPALPEALKGPGEQFLKEEVVTYVREEGYRPTQPYETVKRTERETICWEDLMAGRATVEEFTAQLTDEELAALNCGSGWGVADENHPVIGENSESVPGAAGETTKILTERYHVPSMVMADGPGGIRVRQRYEALDLTSGNMVERTRYCTAWPSGTLLAQGFDPEVLREVGWATAVELEETGVHLLLAPGMNIHRDPLCGRNFEYYSEDPLVSGVMAAAFVEGVQDTGIPVGACIKHFAANNQETNRSRVDEWIDQRALRELYLKGFEIAVKRGKPWAVMTSYNKINGVPTADSYDLCTRLARGEWGFDGLIMTDWNGGSSTASISMHAGNDLIMPGGGSKVREILLAMKRIEPEFDERGQILLTKVFEQLPFYEDHWNSFLPGAGEERIAVSLGEGHLARAAEDGKILVDGQPVYTAAADRFVFLKNKDACPFDRPLTTETAEVAEEGKTIVYRGQYRNETSICRGDLQQCACHILSVLLKMSGKNEKQC